MSRAAYIPCWSVLLCRMHGACVIVLISAGREQPLITAAVDHKGLWQLQLGSYQIPHPSSLCLSSIQSFLYRENSSRQSLVCTFKWFTLTSVPQSAKYLWWHAAFCQTSLLCCGGKKQAFSLLSKLVHEILSFSDSRCIVSISEWFICHFFYAICYLFCECEIMWA